MIGILHPVARPLAAPFGSALAARAFSWRNLFAGGTPGFRINIEEALRINAAAGGDLSKCVAFQDSAGTLPVTAMEQPLGLILDTKLGVPVLGPELVTNGDFSDGLTGWSSSSSHATVNTIVDGHVRLEKTSSTANTGRIYRTVPLEIGKTYRISADLIGASGTTASISVGVGAQTSSYITVSGSGQVSMIWTATDAAPVVRVHTPEVAEGSWAEWDNISIREIPGNHFIQPSNTASRPIVSRRVNLLTATATLATQSVTTLATSYVLTFGGTGSVTLSGAATGTYSAGTHTITTTADTLTVTVSGSVTNADLRLSIDANLPPYQRVTSATDYDEVGFPAYARFDGVDDWLESGVVDMSSTDEVTVIAGVTKLSDAAAGIVVESSVNATSNAGAIALYAPDSAAATYEYTSRGTASADATASGQAAPRKSLLSGVSKISTDTAVLRINGVQAVTSATDQGTGNYGAHKFYMGRRGGLLYPFNGRIYGITVVGKLLDDSTLARAEQAERNLGRLY